MQRAFASLTLISALAVAAATACSRAQPQEQSSEIKAGLAALAKVPYSPARVLTSSDIDALPTTWTLPVPLPLQRIWRLNNGALLLYLADWTESRESIDPDGARGQGARSVVAVGSDGNERWRYSLGWWLLHRVEQSRDGSLLTLGVSSGEGSMSTIVLNADGHEYFRTGTQWKVGLVPSPDGTHLIRTFSETRRTRFSLFREGRTSEVEWGYNVLIGLDGRPFKSDLTLDYGTGSRPVHAVELEGKEALLVQMVDPGTGSSRLDLWWIDGTIAWTLGRAHLVHGGVLASADWAEHPVAVVERWSGERPSYSVESLFISLLDGSTLSKNPVRGLDGAVGVPGRSVVVELLGPADSSGEVPAKALVCLDTSFRPLGWARPSPRQGFTSLDGRDGVIWGQNGDSDDASGVQLATEIFDFRKCLQGARVCRASEPVLPLVFHGTWAVAGIEGGQLTLVGQSSPAEPIRQVVIHE